MPDPQIVYVVAALVVLGLVVWVLVVLLRPATGKKAPVASTAGPPLSNHAPPGSRVEKSVSDRPKLDSHAEIRDEPAAKLARGAREARESEAEDEDSA